MRQHISNPKFFKLLSSYDRVMKLPRGLTYYLQRRNRPEDLSMPLQGWDLDEYTPPLQNSNIQEEL
jgi:hypothetical protein